MHPQFSYTFFPTKPTALGQILLFFDLVKFDALRKGNHLANEGHNLAMSIS
jgi:hypothetical protein